MIQRLPQFLNLNVDTNIEPTIDWIQQCLDLNDAALSKMIQRLPSLLSYNVETNIEPTLNWIQHRLDLDDAALGKMASKNTLIS